MTATVVRTTPAKEPQGSGARGRREKPADFGLDTARLRRLRIIWFSIIAVPVLVLGLLAVRFVSMPLTQMGVRSAYGDKHYDQSISALGPVEFANWFEPYLPHLSRGTALLAKGDNAGAETELRRSLDLWDKGSDLNKPQHAMCKIRNNLALSIERQANTIADPKKRADRLFQAETIIGPCGSGGGGGGGGDGGHGNEDKKTTGENGKRIEDKRRDADKKAGNDPDKRPKPDKGKNAKRTTQDPSNKPRRQGTSGTAPSVQGTTPAGSEEQKKQDEIDKRNKGANGGKGESPSATPSGGEKKPW